MKTEDLMSKNPGTWQEATRHPFLDAVRDGTIPAAAFDAWLAQDYLFAGDLLVFQSRLLARTPRSDGAQAVLAGGLVAVEAELGWFEEKARERSLSLDAPRHPTAAAYRDLLSELEGISYPAAIAALWAIERAYLEAWRSAAPGHPDYREFVEHWTTPEFEEYVSGLQTAADGALARAAGAESEEAERAFGEVARLERDFWEMSFSAGDQDPGGPA